MVRRSLDWKVLLITVVVVGVLSGALCGLHAWQVGRTASGLLVLATAQEKSEEWEKASQYLDRYLRLRIDDEQARIHLAETYGRYAKRMRDKLDSGEEGAPSIPRLQQIESRAVTLYYRAVSVVKPEREMELRRTLADMLINT